MRPRIFEQRIQDKQRPEHKRVDITLKEKPRQPEWRQAPPKPELQDTFLKRVGKAVLPRDLELKWGLTEPTPREKVRERVVRAGEAHLDILREEKWRRRKETVTEYVEAFRDIERKDVARAAKMTGAKFLNLATESIDFVGGLLARHAPDIIGAIGLPSPKLPKEKKQEWVDFVNRNWERMPSHKLKKAVDKLEEAEFMQPSPEWQEATLKEKFGPEHIIETTLHAGTDVVASIGMVALTGPKVGIVALAAPVGADIREQAMEHGWTSDQADLLSVPTAVTVGFLERIVPARIFGGSLKIRNKFIGSFTKRLMETTFLEMGTEFTQETVQMLAEETFREVGFDEAKTRWAMATFGGAMGGAGMQSMATFVDSVRRDGLKMGLMIEEVGKAPDKMPETQFEKWQKERGIKPEVKPRVKVKPEAPIPKELEPLIREAQDLDTKIQLINRKPTRAERLQGKYREGEIIIFTKNIDGSARTVKEIKNTLLHEMGHAFDYKRRGIVADPMGDSIRGFDGKLRPMGDGDIYFRMGPKVKEAENIRKVFPRGIYGMTQKEIYADAYKLFKQDPKKLEKIAPIISGEIADFHAQATKEVKPAISKELEQLAREARKFKTAEEFVEAQVNAFHGTSAKEFKQFGGDIQFFTKNADEAKAFATNPILGGGRGIGRARVINVVLPKGKTKDINTLVQKEVAGEGNIDKLFRQQAKIARNEGFEFLSFQHPSTLVGVDDFKTIIALDPSKVKTKQQLIDFHAQAIKEAKPEVEPPVRKQPTAIERKMGIAPPLAPFVKKRETTLLKDRIRNIARGVREGRRATLEDVKATQTTLIKILEDSGLPAKDWAKFRRSVKNVRTPAELERKLPVLLARANRLIEMQEVRILRKDIGKELKRLTPIRVRGVMKGKLKPEGQERINIIRKAIEMSPEEAQIKLKSNLELLEKGIDPIMEAKIILENEALGVAGAIKSQRVGMEVGIEKLSSIKKRIQEIVDDIEFGKTARDREAINRSEELAKTQKYLTEDVILAGTKLDKTINATPLHQRLFDKTKGRVMQFLDNNLDNLDFWAAKADSFYPESMPMRPDVPYMGWWRETRKLHEANRKYLDSTERDIVRMSNLIVENYNIKTGKDKIRWEKEMVEKINLGNFTLRDGTETTIKMTRQQLIAKYAQLQQEQGLLRLQFGNQWTNEIIDTINKKMRPQDKKMVQNVIDNWYPVIRKEVNPVHEKMTGLKIGEEFNYNPLPTKYAAEMSDQLRLTLQEFQRRSTTPSAVKARVDLSKIDKEMEPQLAPLKFDDFFATALKHSVDMRRYENFTEPIRDMRRLMTGDTRQALTQRFRRHFPQEMDKLMDQMAGGALRDTQNMSELWKVRSKFTTAVFAAEPTRLFKESTSSILWALELQPKSIIKATTDLFSKGRYKKTAQELWNNSPFLRTRYTRRTYERDTAITAAERTPLKLFTQRQDIIEKSLLFQKAGDKFGIYSFGISYFYHHKTRLMKDGVSETEAIKKAAAAFEESARRNQASGEAIDLGQYQRVGEIGPLFSQFKTTVLAMLRQEIHAIRSLGIKHRLSFQNVPVPKDTIARNLTKIALIHLQFMFFQFVADGFRWDEERQKRAFFMGPWGAPIILGDGIDTAVRIVTGDDVFDRGALTAPALSAIGSVFWTGGRGIKNILDGKTDYETLVETFFSIAIPVAHLFGIPAQNLHHLISRSHEFIKGERADPRELIFSDYALEISREKQLPAPRRKREGVFEGRREGIFEGRREKIFEDRRERVF